MATPNPGVQAFGASEMVVALAAKAMKAARAIASFDQFSRIRPPRKAPPIAPMPVTAEQQAVEQRPAARQVARHQRQHRQHHDGAEAEDEAAQHHLFDVRRHGDVAEARRHGGPSVSGGSVLGTMSRFQRAMTRISGQIAQHIDREGGSRAGGGDDDAANRRPDAAGQVEVDAVRHHRCGEQGARHHIADGGLPGRIVERRAAADEEMAKTNSSQGLRHVQANRRPPAGWIPPTSAVGREHHPAAVEIVGDGAGGKRADHDRQSGRRLDQGHHIVGSGNGGHQPSGADRLDQSAEIGCKASANQIARNTGCPMGARGDMRSVTGGFLLRNRG